MNAQEIAAALTEPLPSPRSIASIARDIARNWRDPKTGASAVNYAAKPYLNAMLSLGDMSDEYGADSASSVVSYFLANATTWRGEMARKVKAELNAMLKVHRGR